MLHGNAKIFETLQLVFFLFVGLFVAWWGHVEPGKILLQVSLLNLTYMGYFGTVLLSEADRTEEG